MQKMIKNNPLRVKVLIQYKGPAIMKKLLKVYNQDFQNYSLKVMKCQLPFTGKKWKSQLGNMRTISAIYLQLRSDIIDYFNDSNNPDLEDEEYKKQDQALRQKTEAFNKKHYLEWWKHHELPVHYASELDLLGTDTMFAIKEDIKLEQDFMENYEAWLANEVFNKRKPRIDEIDNIDEGELFRQFFK